MASSTGPPGGLYLVVLHLPEKKKISIGALGEVTFQAGDYVYVGSGARRLEPRVARHRRTWGKTNRWHIDWLRDECRWVEARLLPDAGTTECRLAARIAKMRGAKRAVKKFGASDCRCSGHLIRFRAGTDPKLPGKLDPADGIHARLVERTGRFLARVELPNRHRINVHLPNTARLHDFLVRDCPLLLRPTLTRGRKTDFTAHRAWHGTWVALEAASAVPLLVEHIQVTNQLAPYGKITGIEREVRLADRRIDLALNRARRKQVLVEVTSLSRVQGRTALLSRTPSVRAAAHLQAMSRVARRGTPCASAFVVQRNDATRLRIGEDADPDWVDAVRSAKNAGVDILAYRCRVTPGNAWIEDAIPVVGLDDD